MTSLWLDRSRPDYSCEFAPSEDFDVVVVGAGLTGTVTALLYARTGRKVALLEARTTGAVTTGNTTGKFSLLQGTRLSSIAKKHSPTAVRAYVEANREGQQWLLDYCADNSVAVQRETAFSYANGAHGTSALREEFDAARTAGLDVHWSDTVELPFPVAGAVQLDGQAQFDAVNVLDALLGEFSRRGGKVYENTRVRNVRGTRHCRSIQTERGDITGEVVVIATGTPILDRGGFFARLEPQRSYAAAFAVPGDIPRGMYLSVDEPSRSLRYVPLHQGELLLVGGNGHPVGRASSPARNVDALITWTERMFPGAELKYSWSAQDYRPVNELPYVGQLVPGDSSILIATGYAKWGLTNAVAAALVLTADVTGPRKDWSSIYTTWDWNQIAGLPKAALVNGEVAVELINGWIRPLIGRFGNSDDAVAEGEARVVWDKIPPSAHCTVDGVRHQVSAVCPHLGGILRWNDSERSWDCPLHGSRFAADGALLEGPATSGLE